MAQIPVWDFRIKSCKKILVLTAHDDLPIQLSNFSLVKCHY